MNNPYRFNCNACDYHTNHKSSWDKHIVTELHLTGKRKTRIDKIDDHKCTKCEFKTKNIYNLKQHILNDHSNKEEREKGFKFYCKHCDSGTFSKDTYDKHINSDRHKKIVDRNS